MKVVPCRKHNPWLIVEAVKINKKSSIHMPEFTKPKLAGIIKVVGGPDEALGKLFIADVRQVREQEVGGEVVMMIDEFALMAEITDLGDLEIVDFVDMSIPEICKAGNNFHGEPEFQEIKYGYKG